ncbi:ATP-binding protein [Streptomyces purpurogeneiscleroticus]|uniref:ATP-binding protein n=1 Tax=Streptomyces purpurogeneiscleroticus TaxID=68259 RepID=UPI001CBB7B9F|nr:AAA family ATPase [Streptomyces purpurogeneiscleroticus]MBZ4015754.1 regulator [Streptomyces purpurogeneiscleroticus]
MRRSRGPDPAAFRDRCHRSPAPGNLPAELNRFIGRSDELAALTGMVEGARLVTLTGMGGVGKTRLATQAGRALADRFRDGVWLIELSAVQEPHLLDHAVAESLALADHSGRPAREALCDDLAGSELLLVLDGFEHLVAECAPLVAQLLRRAPGVRVLAAGRRPLGLPGERTCPLLPLPDAEAGELFADRAACVVPGFTVDEANSAAVAELCHRLDGIPLALELAAGRLRALSVDQVLHRLDDRFRLLTGTDRDILPRHQRLRTAIGWSHELCTPQERLLWARLSVFAAQFDLEAAEYVCSGPDLPADELLDVLTELVAQSVVVREETPVGVRYRMLDTVRAYGADWLAALDDTERLRRRHRDWYVGLATWCELDWFGPRQDEVAARLDVELPNVRLALEHSLEVPEEAYLGQFLAGTLWFFWVGCGRLSEGRHWLERSLEMPADHQDARLKALWVTGYVAVLQGDPIGALYALEQCRAEAERAGNARAAAYAQHRLGCLALTGDDMPRAETLLRAALAAYREIGELNSNVLMAQIELAMAVAFGGDLAAAEELCAEVREVCADHGERWAQAYALYVLAYAAWTRGDLPGARRLLTECLVIDHTFHDLLGAVLAVELLALVTLDEGDAAEAAVLQGIAARIWPSVGPQLFGSHFFNQPHELCERRARGELGDAGYEVAVRRGRALDLDAAVTRILGELPRPRGGAGSRPPETGEPAVSPAANGGETAG